MSPKRRSRKKSQANLEHTCLLFFPFSFLLSKLVSSSVEVNSALSNRDDCGGVLDGLWQGSVEDDSCEGKPWDREE